MGSDEPNIASRLVRSIEVRFPTVWRSVGDPALEILRMIRIDQVGVEAGSMTYGALLSIPPFLLSPSRSSSGSSRIVPTPSNASSRPPSPPSLGWAS